MQAGLWRRVVAECVGTAMLVLVGAGSVVAALRAGGGEVGYASLGFTSLTFAIVVAVVIHGFGPVSGAHINPAVTRALAATRRFPWAEVLPYVVARLVGAFVGAVLIIAVFGSGAVELGLGATSLGEGVPHWRGIVAVSLGTFLLLFAVMEVAVDSRAPLGWAGLVIGLAAAAAILLIAPQTGGSLNPARTFGPYLALAPFGGQVPRRAQAPAAEESYTPNPPEEA